MGDARHDSERYHRRSVRLKGYDYASPGAYLVTICAAERKCLFGQVVTDAMRPNAWGDVVAACWNQIPAHFPNVRLDAFVLMPNHLHGILIIENATDGRGTTSPRARDYASRAPTIDPVDSTGQRFGVLTAQSLPTVIRSFKAAVTQRVRALASKPDLQIWQRNYHEHVIRNEESLNEIRRYIQQNPLRWSLDRENPTNIRENRVRR
jgi:putative transposase